MFGLEGIRIVSFNHFLMGPVGVQYLGDLGVLHGRARYPGAAERLRR